MNAIGSRQSHADANVAHRQEKAGQILEVLTDYCGDLSDKQALDIGTGSGVIASVLCEHFESLTSVDVVDERVVRSFEFQLIDSEALPFPEESFDVIISNHVIEHVHDKLHHLREVRRVLRADGVAYLAMPNKWALVEPHFSLPALSWLPQRIADRYVRATGKGTAYDVEPLDFRCLSELSEQAALTLTDRSTELASQKVRRATGIQQRMTDHLHRFFPSYVVLATAKRP
ncbi:MAG: class I SAM-dependent methyltransferase [Dehalococcoidia bacterium]